jgi:hypothetical protein
MSTHIRESILAELETTLNTIRTTGGYNYNVTAERWKRSGNPMAEAAEGAPKVVIYAGPEDKEPGPDPQTSSKWSIILDCWMVLTEDSTELPDTALNKLLLDIEKAIMIDYTRGGYAEFTQEVSVVPFTYTEGRAYFGVLITLDIQYKHRNTDPSTYD